MKKLLFSLLFCPLWLLAQSNGTRLIGKVLDENNEGIEGVKILLHHKPIPSETSKGLQGAFEIPTLNTPIENRIFLKIEKKGYVLVDAFDGNLYEVTPAMRKTGYLSVKMRKVPQLNEKPRLAVLPFCNFDEQNNPIFVRAFVAPIRRGLAEVDTSKIQIIPYSLVEYAMRKHNLRPEDYCDQTKIFAVGNELRANIVVTGAYQFLAERLNVDCEFTDIIQKTDFKDPIFLAKPKNELPKLQDELTNEIVKRFGIKPNAQETELISSWTSESTPKTDAYIDYANGLQALDDKEPEKAEQQFQKSLEKDAQNARAWQEQAAAQTEQGKSSEAEKSLTKAEKLAENKPKSTQTSLWKKIGQLFARNKQPERAAKTFKKVKENEPSFEIPEERNSTSLRSGISEDFDMVFVQGGTFQMGYDPKRDGKDEYVDNAKPLHTVELDDFYIGKTEVTQKQWRAIMGSDPPELNFKGCDNCPVENVSWDDIQEFLKKLNEKTGKKYSLPSEAQWEYAARGGNKSKNFMYSGSNNLDEVAWYKGNSGNKTHEVGTRKPNELGLYDMSGNVWEWCEDEYESDFYGTAEAKNKNPINNRAKNNKNRVLRGGSWNDFSTNCRPTYRNDYQTTYRLNIFGFRFILIPQ